MKRPLSDRFARPLAIAFLGTLLVSASAALVSRSRGPSVRVLLPRSLSAPVDTLPPGSSLSVDGGSVTLSPTQQTPKLGPSAAYAGYLKWAGGVAAFSVKPTYAYGLFTDANVRDPDKTGALVARWQNAPVWLVLFRGVMVQPVGKGSAEPVLNDVSYFVSDDTGAVLEELTGPVTVAAG
jgi:hypothetical protein